MGMPCTPRAMIYLVMALGVGCLLLGMREAGAGTLACRRPEPGQVNCHQQRSTWFGLVTLSETDFNRVQKARFERTTKGSPYVVLVTADGETELGDFPPEQTSDLNAFLDSTEPTLVVRQSRWVGVLVLWLVGGLLI